MVSFLAYHPCYSVAFLMYTLIVSLIHLYSITGRNAAASASQDASIELTAANKWYAPVPAADMGEEPVHHVIGDEDD